MSSVSGVNLQKPKFQQNLQDVIVLKTEQQSHYDTLTSAVSKEANPKVGLLSHTSSQMSNSERIKVTNPKVHLQQHIHFPNFKIQDGLQTTRETQMQEAKEGPETGTVRHSSETKASREEAEKVDKVTQMFASKERVSNTVSSTLSLMSGTEQSTSSLQSFSTAHTPTMTAVTNTAVRHTVPTVTFAPTSPHHPTKSDLPLCGTEKDKDQQVEIGFQFPPLSQPQSVDTQEPTETSTSTLSTSSSISSPPSSALYLSSSLGTFSASTSSSPRSTESSIKTQLPHVAPSETSSKTGYYHLTMDTTSKPPLLSLLLSRRPVCPYPPVPAHGTFYFRNVENPGPREYRHYIQYACYPGYTLAHGDIHSYCLQGGTWSGITPVCLGRLLLLHNF